MKYFFIFPIIPAGFRPEFDRIRSESGRIPGGSGRIPDRNQLSGVQKLYKSCTKVIQKLYKSCPKVPQ
jgi:hypothetical protein